MLDCFIIGDSIALGTAHFRPECAVMARSGISSKGWVDKNITRLPINSKTVIISLGSNDTKNIKSAEEFHTIRTMTKADRIFWILPANKPEVHDIVKSVAEYYGDTVLPITKLEKDGVHPTVAGYKDLAEKTK